MWVAVVAPTMLNESRVHREHEGEVDGRGEDGCMTEETNK